MDDHVRIELLDPKWREQKLAAELKKKESNLLQEGLLFFFYITFHFNLKIMCVVKFSF